MHCCVLDAACDYHASFFVALIGWIEFMLYWAAHGRNTALHDQKLSTSDPVCNGPLTQLLPWFVCPTLRIEIFSFWSCELFAAHQSCMYQVGKLLSVCECTSLHSGSSLTQSALPAGQVTQAAQTGHACRAVQGQDWQTISIGQASDGRRGPNNQQ